jgi:hypothetical protein
MSFPVQLEGVPLSPGNIPVSPIDDEEGFHVVRVTEECGYQICHLTPRVPSDFLGTDYTNVLQVEYRFVTPLKKEDFENLQETILLHAVAMSGQSPFTSFLSPRTFETLGDKMDAFLNQEEIRPLQHINDRIHCVCFGKRDFLLTTDSKGQITNSCKFTSITPSAQYKKIEVPTNGLKDDYLKKSKVRLPGAQVSVARCTERGERSFSNFQVRRPDIDADLLLFLSCTPLGAEIVQAVTVTLSASRAGGRYSKKDSLIQTDEGVLQNLFSMSTARLQSSKTHALSCRFVVAHVLHRFLTLSTFFAEMTSFSTVHLPHGCACGSLRIHNVIATLESMLEGDILEYSHVHQFPAFRDMSTDDFVERVGIDVIRGLLCALRECVQLCETKQPIDLSVAKQLMEHCGEYEVNTFVSLFCSCLVDASEEVVAEQFETMKKSHSDNFEEEVTDVQRERLLEELVNEMTNVELPKGVKARKDTKCRKARKRRDASLVKKTVWQKRIVTMASSEEEEDDLDEATVATKAIYEAKSTDSESVYQSFTDTTSDNVSEDFDSDSTKAHPDEAEMEIRGEEMSCEELANTSEQNIVEEADVDNVFVKRTVKALEDLLVHLLRDRAFVYCVNTGDDSEKEANVLHILTHPVVQSYMYILEGDDFDVRRESAEAAFSEALGKSSLLLVRNRKLSLR